MKPAEQDRLLKEILTGEEVADFRQASLERGLATVREGRRRRRAVQVCAWAFVSLLLGVGIAVHRSRETPSGRSASTNRRPVGVAPSSAGTPEVKLITDEELFALFPGRPLALIGKRGHQQLVFLDEPPANTGGDL